jgi:predicted extracellular nuclease
MRDMRHHRFRIAAAGVLLAVCVTAGVTVCSCTEHQLEHLVLMSWNVQNLFDGEHDGAEYHEFDPHNGSWDAAAYHTRLERMSSIMRDAGADIIMLQEIEGEQILEDLQRYLGAGSFPYYSATADPYSAIQQGVLSRYPITAVTVHRPLYTQGTSGRSILQVHIAAGEEQLICFVNHWKSRTGGVCETERARTASSKLVKLLVQEVHREHPRALVIVAGDLNTSISDAPEGLPAGEHALIVRQPGRTSQVLEVTGDRSAAEGPLYDFWSDPSTDLPRQGSYWYGGDWKQFDHILGDHHLFDHRGFDLSGVEICSDGALVTDDGNPFRYAVYSGAGYSDHLPVIMRLMGVR